MVYKGLGFLHCQVYGVSLNTFFLAKFSFIFNIANKHWTFTHEVFKIEKLYSGV